eukprot:scaffold6677_cov155-Skeletonema_menzelii.AAC.23
MSFQASNSLGGVSKNGQSSADADPSTFRSNGDVNQPANLNILNQANNISQLSVNNTSFDPSQLVANNSDAQQADGVITAFSGLVVQSSNVDNGSAAAVALTTSMNGTNNLRVSPTLQQNHVVPLQIPQQQLVQTNHQTLVQSNNNNNISPPTVSPPPNASVMVQQQQVTHHHQSQMPYHHHVQPKHMQNGRVPATKHDNRKLFVGGLPNEVTDYSFLQFFQQYGEVVDSIVLLDRRTKRSRGFGFVTFADESVANALLNVIPGRTGTVNIFGKSCEIKASEPKTEESYHQQPHLHNHHHQSHQWGDNNYTPQRLVFGANGAAIHPINNQSGVGPQTLQTPVGAEQGVGVPLYSHSTITRTTAGPILSVDGSPQEGVANVYIQNNFYTLPPGTQLSPSHPLNAPPTMETLQVREEEFVNGGGTVTYTHQQTTLNPGAPSHAPFAYPGESLQPAYPGPDVENSAGN